MMGIRTSWLDRCTGHMFDAMSFAGLSCLQVVSVHLFQYHQLSDEVPNPKTEMYHDDRR
jgi:hypothetical protein